MFHWKAWFTIFVYQSGIFMPFYTVWAPLNDLYSSF